MTVIEAPDDAAVTALGLSLGKSGNVRTETLRVIVEVRQIDEGEVRALRLQHFRCTARDPLSAR